MRRFVTAALLIGLVPATALAQQQPAPTGTPTQPSPEAVPAQPAAEPATPAATATLPAPAAVPTAPAAPARTPTPWGGSQLNVQTSANGAFFDRSYTLSGDNVSVADLSVTLSPRYRINRMFQLRARWDFALEFTNSDTTTTQREPRFLDPSLDLWARFPPIGNLGVAVAAGFIFPVSPESRANTLITTPRLIVQAAWSAEILGGEFALIGRAVYSHPFFQSTTSERRGQPFYSPTCVPTSGTCGDQLRGGTNVHDQVSWAVIVAQTWGNWSPGLFFQMTHQWAYDVANDDTTNATPGASGSHIRQSTFFAGWLDYNPNPWLTLEAGYQMARPILDADGTYGNPIYSPYQDWRVYLSANVVLDKFFEAISGAGAGGGGVIRTQNTPRRNPLTATF